MPLPPSFDPCAYKFGKALISPRWTICGVELRPFSLGHFIILEETGSPVMAATPAEIPMKDSMYWFFQALLICGATYEDNMEILNDEKAHKEIADKFSDNLMANIKAAEDGWNIYSQLRAFKEYVDFYFDVPVYNEERTDSKSQTPSGIDWKQSIYFVMKKLGYSESEILNMSFRKLFYEWCSCAEAEGAIKVWNAFDLESLARSKGLINHVSQ